MQLYVIFGMIPGKLNELTPLYKKRDVQESASALMESLYRSLRRMCHSSLHAFSQAGTSNIVENHVNLISYLLAYIAQRLVNERENEERSRIQAGVSARDLAVGQLADRRRLQREQVALNTGGDGRETGGHTRAYMEGDCNQGCAWVH